MDAKLNNFGDVFGCRELSLQIRGFACRKYIKFLWNNYVHGGIK